MEVYMELLVNLILLTHDIHLLSLNDTIKFLQKVKSKLLTKFIIKLKYVFD